MTGLRERKKRETRLALSQATIRLVIERGWEQVSVEDIAAAANVSERTFRNYFASKAEAVAASHLERALVVADELRAQPASEPLWPSVFAAASKSLRAGGSEAAGPGRESESASSGVGGGASPRDEAYMARVKLVLAHPSLHAELLRADDIAKEELAAAIAERLGLDVERDLFPRLAASVSAAAIATAMRHWMVNDPTGSVIEVLERAFTEIGRGLPVPEGES
ncbi:TetR family transcriptional regulator [Kutzneria sp. NPDC052558]|uniref:acyl-CoA-like ligand-binding transcription factor n=1 Tax=Kutzneria sp. NPDC052558 TaxID=3364121 RepID=UPI0037C5C4E0